MKKYNTLIKQIQLISIVGITCFNCVNIKSVDDEK